MANERQRRVRMYSNVSANVKQKYDRMVLLLIGASTLMVALLYLLVFRKNESSPVSTLDTEKSNTTKLNASLGEPLRINFPTPEDLLGGLNQTEFNREVIVSKCDLKLDVVIAKNLNRLYDC